MKKDYDEAMKAKAEELGFTEGYDAALEKPGLVHDALYAVISEADYKALQREQESDKILIAARENFFHVFGHKPVDAEITRPTDPTSTGWTVTVRMDGITLVKDEQNQHWRLGETHVPDLATLGRELMGLGYRLTEETS